MMTLCPFDQESPSVAAVEAFRSSVPLGSLLMLSFLMVIVKAILKIKIHLSKQQQQQQSAEWGPLLQPEGEHLLPSNNQNLEDKWDGFLCRLKAGYVNLMLLGYSSIALFTLRSVYCVSLPGNGVEDTKTHLFIQASVECYQPWQQLAIVVILLWIAPFPIVLYVGGRLLRSHRITANHFLLVLTVPPVCIYFALCSGVGSSRGNWSEGGSDSRTRERILSVMNKPFRQITIATTPTTIKQALIWEPVLIGRRLLLVVMTTLILSSPIIRLCLVGFVLIVFALHDYRAKPYNSDHLNLLQLLSTLVLALLLMVNMFWALTNDVDVMDNHDYYVLGEVFIILEVILLVLPFLITFRYIVFKFIKFCIGKLLNQRCTC